MTSATHALTWFEIPVADMNRAQRFYEQLLATGLKRETIAGSELAVFPYNPQQGVGGCLQSAYEGGPAVGGSGSLVYLDAGPLLQGTLDRATALGAKLLLPRTELPPGMGCFAHIEDCEGNRVGLHAPA